MVLALDLSWWPKGQKRPEVQASRPKILQIARIKEKKLNISLRCQELIKVVQIYIFIYFTLNLFKDFLKLQDVYICTYYISETTFMGI